MITWAKLKTGEWGVRSTTQIAGKVKVTSKSGEVKEATIDKEVWKDKGGTVFLYTIFRNKKGRSNKPWVPMNGQVWEECQRCGKEPIYLPLELCEDCWPER